jgi:predicted metal-dependent phosphoesterase TrpH
MKADLHMHSTYSDGTLSHKELVDRAIQKKMDVISITDHDVIGTEYSKTIEYAKTKGVTVIPGIELSTVENEKNVHILGYFTDHSFMNKAFLDRLSLVEKRREERAQEFILNLKKYFNIEIDYKRVKEVANGIIARPHLAAVIEENYPQYNHDYIFKTFLGNDSIAFVPTVKMSVQDGISFLKEYGAIVVLAHPVLLKKEIESKVLSYEYDGIEAYYTLNTELDTKKFVSIAHNRDLLITAGSDYHGIKGDTRHGDIGDVYLKGDELKKFLSHF